MSQVYISKWEEEIVSKYDTKVTLDFLLNEKESVIFERKWIFKPNWEIGFSPSKVANEIIWMLNADGGILVIGIHDTHIQDLKTLDNTKYNDYLQVVHNFINPSALVHCEAIMIGEKTIVLYHIPSERERIFCRNDNEEVYFRNGDETVKYNREEVKVLEYNKSIRKFEEEKREDFQREDFRESVLEYYKNKIHFNGTHDELLVYRNLATKKDEKYFYNNASILLFAEHPEKYISSASVRYVRYSGTKLEAWKNFNVIKDESFEWSIPRLIELVRRFLSSVFRDYYYLDVETWKFDKISEYPQDAWLEWIVNAMTHRSYNIQWNVIYIKHFDDRLEISNSWPLPGWVTVENIKEKRFSRNPRIAKVLSEMWYVRELNEGVKRIYQSMKDSLLAEPEYIDKEDMVTLVLRNNVSKDEDTISERTMKKIENIFIDLNESEKVILTYILIHKKSTIIDLTKSTFLSEKVVRKYLLKFITEEIISKESDKKRDKNALYRIKK